MVKMQFFSTNAVSEKGFKKENKVFDLYIIDLLIDHI